MSDKTTNDKSDKKPRRRLKAPTETVRQRQASELSRADRPTKQRRSAVGRFLSWPFRKVAGWSIWQAKALKPVRFVVRWVGLIVWPPYFRRSVEELKRVTWPNWKQSWRLTFAVLAFAAVFGLLIAGVDFVFDKLFREVLLK
jgi:preprotein translocase SecE subunit